MRSWFQTKKCSDIITYMLLAIMVFLVFVNMMMTHIGKYPDKDIFWHYILGRDILANKSLSLANPYTFLSNTEWVLHEWLYEVLLCSIVSAGGALGFCALYAINKITMFAVTHKIQKPKSHFWFFVMFVTSYTTVSMNRGNRPAEFSVYAIFFIFLWYWSTSKYKKLWYALLGAFIANFHGGFIIIMMTIHAILMVLDLCMDIYEKSFRGKRYYIQHLLDLVVFAFACLINPAGYKLFSSSFLLSSADTTWAISEWLPTQFHTFFAFLVVLMVLSFGYALRKQKWNRLDVQKIGCMCALLILAMVSVKAFLVYVAVYLAFGFSYTYEMVRDICVVIKDEWIVKDKLENMPKISMNIKLCLLIYVTVLVNIFTYFDVKADIDKVQHNDFILWANDFYSDEILDTLRENYDENTKILTSYSYGNILLLNDMKCFVDTRQWCYIKEFGDCTALDELFYITNSSLNDKEAIDIFLEKYQFDYIWTNDELRLTTYLEMSEDYELVVSYEEEKETDGAFYERDVKSCEYLYQRVDS